MLFSLVSLLLLALLLPRTVHGEDLMAVCYSFTSVDMCHPNAPATSAEATTTHSRKLLAKQGPPRSSPEYQKRRALTTSSGVSDSTRIDCGVFCSGWSTFCAEYMCDADTMGMTCDDITAEAKLHMQTIATTVGTEECNKQMDPTILECICVDQDK
jgi:hypothetical protein